MKKQTTSKQVQVIARIQFKCDPRKVVYLSRSSKGLDEYQTFLFDGIACSCNCPATKPCYHMVQLEAIEQKRIAEQEAAKSEQEYQAMGHLVAPKLQCRWQAQYASDPRKMYAAPLNERNAGFALLR